MSDMNLYKYITSHPVSCVLTENNVTNLCHQRFVEGYPGAAGLRSWVVSLAKRNLSTNSSDDTA